MENNKKIGVITCTMIVAGNMMGSGIAMLPGSLASVGSITIISWIFAIIGALGIAYVFARLGTEDPEEGGPVAYANKISPVLGYQAQVLYFHANWIGNLAIAITSIAYLQPLIPSLNNPLLAGIVTIGEIWLLTLINLKGSKWIGVLASIGLVFVLIPVIGTGVFGWFKFNSGIFIANWNMTNHANSEAVISGILLCLWSFIGVESASVDSNLVENPKRTIMLSTLFGVFIAAVVYLASTTVINGMFSAKAIIASDAPFSMAIATLTNPFIGKMVSLLMSLACFASLGSWMMLVAEAGARASHDGNLPKVFGRKNANGVPIKSIAYTSSFMSLLMLFFMLYQQNMQKVFGEIISIAVLLTVIPYFYSALHLIEITPKKPKAYIQIIISIIGALFCFAAFFGATLHTLIGTVIVSFGVLVFYANRQRPQNE